MHSKWEGILVGGVSQSVAQFTWRYGPDRSAFWNKTLQPFLEPFLQRWTVSKFPWLLTVSSRLFIVACRLPRFVSLSLDQVNWCAVGLLSPPLVSSLNTRGPYRHKLHMVVAVTADFPSMLPWFQHFCDYMSHKTIFCFCRHKLNFATHSIAGFDL